jgi:methyl-accepting chemotaxis protein
MARGNSNAVQQTVQAAPALQTAADELQQTVERFKV